MISSRKNFTLDFIDENDKTILSKYGTHCYTIGLIIKFVETDKTETPIAFIFSDTESNAHSILFIEDRLQTYITLPETYADLIYIIDFAYDFIDSRKS